MKKSPELRADNERVSQWALVAWVGFLSASLLEGLVFSMLDPGEVNWSGHVPQPTRQGIYTIAFLCFWFISSASAGVALWLSKSPDEVNDTATD